MFEPNFEFHMVSPDFAKAGKSKQESLQTLPRIVRHMLSKLGNHGQILLRAPRSFTLRKDFGLHHVTPARFAFLQLPHPHDAFPQAN